MIQLNALSREVVVRNRLICAPRINHTLIEGRLMAPKISDTTTT